LSEGLITYINHMQMDHVEQRPAKEGEGSNEAETSDVLHVVTRARKNMTNLTKNKTKGDGYKGCCCFALKIQYAFIGNVYGLNKGGEGGVFIFAYNVTSSMVNSSLP
jgi:hypothetical protein